LLRSVDDYEAGHTDEARRMALTVRVLLHDTDCSVSLLTHLGLKGKLTFYDTASEVDPHQAGTHLSLLVLLFTAAPGRSPQSKFEARLDDQPTSPKEEMQPFDEWWDTTVIRDDQGNRYSRRDIVLTLADQDGGAHVDIEVSDKYLRLVAGQATGWRELQADQSEGLVEGLELATSRQIAHEVLVTLARHCPGCFPTPDLANKYANESMKPDAENWALFADIRFYGEDDPHLGRNDPCWCGSGRKLKKCHDGPGAKSRHERGKQPWAHEDAERPGAHPTGVS
jgi:hypothetical protein